jgi:hypothetical protein
MRVASCQEGKQVSSKLFDCQFYVMAKLPIKLSLWFVPENRHALSVGQVSIKCFDITGRYLFLQLLDPNLKIQDHIDILHFLAIVLTQ